ncbi:MAG TPA: CBS domain-containing protein [Ktedonobacteraceae bacterium]|nr:CBS domain-containing protein [Ktedonobacteraceae bacterium]
MIVGEIMTTKLITLKSDDLLGHAVNLLRQYQFHHLPIARSRRIPGKDAPNSFVAPPEQLLFEGMLSSYDIDLVVVRSTQQQRPWQDLTAAEVMTRAVVCVTPNTNVAAAAQILVERGLNALPVVEYEQEDATGEAEAQGSVSTRTVLVGLLTRSDLLISLARALGAYEPGMQLTLPLPGGDLRPLSQMLNLAAEMHVPIRSLLASPGEGGVPTVATVRLGTINPAPLLVKLHEAGIRYSFVDPALVNQPT